MEMPVVAIHHLMVHTVIHRLHRWLIRLHNNMEVDRKESLPYIYEDYFLVSDYGHVQYQHSYPEAVVPYSSPSKPSSLYPTLSAPPANNGVSKNLCSTSTNIAFILLCISLGICRCTFCISTTISISIVLS